LLSLCKNLSVSLWTLSNVLALLMLRISSFFSATCVYNTGVNAPTKPTIITASISILPAKENLRPDLKDCFAAARNDENKPCESILRFVLMLQESEQHP
jgi:hypothetical protein